MTQEEALNILKFGHNVYLTGPAGSGKTHILNQYIDYLRDRDIQVAVTASTGIAGTHIGGQTIHSWSGIGVRNHLSPYDLDQLEQKRGLYKQYENTKVLIIDEISMLSADQLDMVDQIARHMCRDERPFGGMQVVFSGDFFQLPPVSRYNEEVYAFDSNVWRAAPPIVCYLESQYRQTDPKLYSVLEYIRSGDGEAAADILKSRINTEGDSRSEAVKLFTHNVDVDKINEEELDRLSGEEHIFKMTSKGAKSAVASLQKGCLALEELRLKIDAKVMFVKNDPRGAYVNGTLGTVVGMKGGYPQVRTSDGRLITAEPVSWQTAPESSRHAEINQIPLRLAWAITIHKSQGMTIDAAEIDLSKTFVAGQGYVALSRVRSLDGLFLQGINSKALEVDERVVLKDSELRARSEAAANRIRALDDETIKKKADEFCVACGGELDPEKQEVKKRERQKGASTVDKTKVLVIEKKGLSEIATLRGLKEETVISHIQKLIDSGESVDIEYLRKSAPHLEEILSVFRSSDSLKLSPVKSELEKKGIDVSFRDLALARLFV